MNLSRSFTPVCITIYLLPVPKLPWTHSQANLSASSTVATPCDVIEIVAAPGDTIQLASAPVMPVQPMPSELPASCSRPSVTWPHPTATTSVQTCLRGSIHPLDRLPHSARWGFQSFSQGSLHSVCVSAIQLDSCDMSPSNQPDLRDPLTSAQSDGPVLDVQFIFKGLGDPAQTPDGLLMPLPIPKKPLVLNKSSRPLPTSLPVSEDNLKYKVSQVLDSQLSKGILQYLVHWKGFGPEERSWITASKVFSPRLLRRFYLESPF